MILQLRFRPLPCLVCCLEPIDAQKQKLVLALFPGWSGYYRRMAKVNCCCTDCCFIQATSHYTWCCSERIDKKAGGMLSPFCLIYKGETTDNVNMPCSCSVSCTFVHTFALYQYHFTIYKRCITYFEQKAASPYAKIYNLLWTKGCLKMVFILYAVSCNFLISWSECMISDGNFCWQRSGQIHHSFAVGRRKGPTNHYEKVVVCWHFFSFYRNNEGAYGPARYRNLAYREGVHPVPKYLYSALKAPNRILGRKVMPPVDPNVYLSHPVNPQVPTARSGPSGRRVKPDHVNLEFIVLNPKRS